MVDALEKAVDRAAFKAALASQRERCAKLAEDIGAVKWPRDQAAITLVSGLIAKAIRDLEI